METNAIIYNYNGALLPEIKLCFENNIPVEQRYLVKDSASAYELLTHLWDINTIELEMELKVLFLNKANAVIGIRTVSQGSTAHIELPISQILATAISCNAVSLILALNHPSGNLKPSDNTLRNADKLRYAAMNFDIKLFDFIIITKEQYHSLADSGLIQG